MKLTVFQPIPTITNDDELDAAIADFEQLDRSYGDNVTPEENTWLFAYRDEIDRYERAAGHHIGLDILPKKSAVRYRLVNVVEA